jgi:hypothetical protein
VSAPIEYSYLLQSMPQVLRWLLGCCVVLLLEHLEQFVHCLWAAAALVDIVVCNAQGWLLLRLLPRQVNLLCQEEEQRLNNLAAADSRACLQMWL